jgi:hypothetical protein
MQHSTWDLEVHAREMQQRRQREADRARQIEAACQRGDRMRVSPTRFSISRLMTAFRYALSLRPIPTDGAEIRPLADARLRPLPAEESRRIPDAPARGLSQPYAGMVVLARGTRGQSTAQPCVAGDC